MTADPSGHEEIPQYVTALRSRGIDPVVVTSAASLDEVDPGGPTAIALIETSGMPSRELASCVRACAELRLPSIALVPHDRAGQMDELIEVDDFILGPPRIEELALRAARLIERRAPDEKDVVRVEDMVINTANFEVTVGRRRVSLRYKEYELLLLMASSPGRVFSREALLNRIWGYDYLGGTRTVDVHIRRLRSKIEDAEHTFIETVWQVGYRFRPPDLRDLSQR